MYFHMFNERVRVNLSHHFGSRAATLSSKIKAIYRPSATQNHRISSLKSTRDRYKFWEPFWMYESKDEEDENVNKADIEKTNFPLSKNAQKRLARAKRFEENLESFRNFKKQKRRERREKRRDLNIAKVRLPTRLMSDIEASKARIVIHCGYSHLMNKKINRNLTHQMIEAYGVNRRSEHPAQLYFTRINDEYKELFHKYCSNYTSWDVNIVKESYLDIFDKNDIIYLTSESPNQLQRIDDTKVYIIGGLIDRNFHKGLTLKEANDNNIQHQSLPISQYMKMKKGYVLTTNQVFEIITAMICNGNNMKMALEKVVPKRNIIEKNVDNSETYC